MFKSIGVCGTGNMGQAIVKGLVASKAIAADHIYLYNIHREKAAALAEETGAVVVDSPLELAKRSQALIMGVKPNMMERPWRLFATACLRTVSSFPSPPACRWKALPAYAGEATKIIRVMPNTPAMVGQGMASISPNGMVTAEETADAVAVFSSFGKAEVVDEKMIDAVCGSAEVVLLTSTCLLKPWPMVPFSKACRVRWPIPLPPRPCWGRRRWFLKREPTPAP